MKSDKSQNTSRFIIFEEKDGTFSVVIRVNPFLTKKQAKEFIDIIAYENGYETEELVDTGEERTLH
ncbi:hypothetical protein N9M26_01050 [Alphaproteobacteria bacterium]|nr:hypothetical protein [Alphaproteobacteria bacterium]